MSSKKPDDFENSADDKAVNDKAAAESTSQDETLTEPVLDGANEKAPDVDPRKGMSDPALIRDIDSGEKTVNPYG